MNAHCRLKKPQGTPFRRAPPKWAASASRWPGPRLAMVLSVGSTHWSWALTVSASLLALLIACASLNRCRCDFDEERYAEQAQTSPHNVTVRHGHQTTSPPTKTRQGT